MYLMASDGQSNEWQKQRQMVAAVCLRQLPEDACGEAVVKCSHTFSCDDILRSKGQDSEIGPDKVREDLGHDHWVGARSAQLDPHLPISRSKEGVSFLENPSEKGWTRVRVARSLTQLSDSLNSQSVTRSLNGCRSIPLSISLLVSQCLHRSGHRSLSVCVGEQLGVVTHLHHVDGLDTAGGHTACCSSDNERLHKRENWHGTR